MDSIIESAHVQKKLADSAGQTPGKIRSFWETTKAA